MPVRHNLADGIDLWLGDCRDVLPQLSAVSHVITDPPYEQLMHDLHSSTELKRTDGGSQRRDLSFDSIQDVRPEFLKETKRINAGWLLVFCNIEGVWFWREAIEAADMKFKLACIWIKPDATPKMNGQGPAIGYECIATAWSGAGYSRWNGGGRRGVFTHLTNSPDREGTHETEKPLSLMKELVALFSNAGETICDPFMGSGTTGIACVRLGRKFIGVEKDEKFFELAKRRISFALEQPDMFVDVPKPKQEKIW